MALNRVFRSAWQTVALVDVHAVRSTRAFPCRGNQSGWEPQHRFISCNPPRAGLRVRNKYASRERRDQIPYSTMPRSELVNDMRMNAVFRDDGSIEHRFVHHSARETTGSWPEPEVWKRGDTLGKGAFGVVYVEKCASPQQPPRFRAVKVISNESDPSTRRYVDQELEAIAKFSQPKVRAMMRIQRGHSNRD